MTTNFPLILAAFFLLLVAVAVALHAVATAVDRRVAAHRGRLRDVTPTRLRGRRADFDERWRPLP